MKRKIAIVLLATVIALLPLTLGAQLQIEIEHIGSFGTLGDQPGEFNSFGGVTVLLPGLYASGRRIQAYTDVLGACPGRSTVAPGGLPTI